MKVVVSGYIGKKITGIGRNLISLLDASESGIEYVIYTNYDIAKDFQFRNPRVTVKTYPVSSQDSMKNLLWTTFVFPLVVLKEGADRALIPNFTLLLFKFRRTAVILNDLIEFHVPQKFSRLKMFYRTKLADPVTARRADTLITISKNSKQDIVKFLHIPPEKIGVVCCGVDREKFRRMPEEESARIFAEKGWPEDFLLYAGTIDHPGKNAMSVIRAFERLKAKKKYDGKLILAGMPGSGYEKIERHVSRSKVKDDIILTGYVTDRELVALYSRCRVFCFLSLYEGFGIPPLEALSCGAQVIVSSTSSLPEVVGSVGFTVDPEDITQITQCIGDVLAGKCRADEAQISQHLRYYDWKRLSAHFEKLLMQ